MVRGGNQFRSHPHIFKELKHHHNRQSEIKESFSENFSQIERQQKHIQQHNSRTVKHRVIFLHPIGKTKKSCTYRQRRQHIPAPELFLQQEPKAPVPHGQQHKGKQKRKPKRQHIGKVHPVPEIIEHVAVAADQQKAEQQYRQHLFPNPDTK